MVVISAFNSQFVGLLCALCFMQTDFITKGDDTSERGQHSCSPNMHEETDGPTDGKAKMQNEPPTSSLAVVAYDSSLISPFHQPERKFTFGGHEIVIKQDWGQQGVAGVVWDAAVTLCDFLYDKRDELRSSRIIELGAGTGIVGILLAKLGLDVTLTDRQVSLPVLQDNVQLNTPPGFATVRALDWGINHMDFQPEYDYLIGADVIYVEKTFQLLLDTLLHLAKPGVRVIISCRIRYERDTRFLDMMREHFTLVKVHTDTQRQTQILQGERKVS